MLILITGKAGSGKDTIGEYLCKKYDFKTDSLAAPIKRLVQDVFVLPEETVYDRVLRELPLKDPWEGYTVRSLLQQIGTELFRTQINPDIWALSLFLRIKKEPKRNWAVTDVRFPNEKDVLSSRYKKEVFTIKVKRKGKTGKTKGGIKKHSSETHDLEADFTISNNGTYEDLYRKIDKIMKRILC